MFVRIGLIVLCIFGVWKLLGISGVGNGLADADENVANKSISTKVSKNSDAEVELGLYSHDETDQLKKELNAYLYDKSKEYEQELLQVNSLLANKQYEDASRLLQSTRNQFPDQPELLSRHAETIALMNNGNFSGQPYELLSRALDIDIQHKPSLWMMALVNQQSGNHEAAVILLKLLKRELPKDSKAIETINSAMAMSMVEYENSVDAAAQEEASLVPKDTAAESVTESATSAPSINLFVTLEPEIVNQFSPDDTVFIYARAGRSDSMPLAVTRRQISDFPTTVTLDNSMAMTPTQNLSSSELVTVGARASRSGTAMPLKGDWEVELYDVPIETKHLIPLNVHFELK